MKFVLLSCLQVFTIGLLCAQSPDFVVKSSNKEPYLEYKVGAKENFFSIGRLFNIHPRHIAGYNGLEMSKGLSLSQVLKIPLSDTNFIQAGGKGVPLYYITGEGEGLSAVSNKNGMVSLNELRRWNGIKEDAIKPGTKLIVGFLITKEMKDLAVNIPESKATDKITTPQEKKEEIVKKTEPEIKKEIPVVYKEEQKKAEPVVVNHEGRVVATGTGYFKSDFEKQVKKLAITKEQTVTSGIFKTTSGWQDAKYYLLIDKVEPGTIVKILNPINNKVVYAKVLYSMEGIRQNQGLDIRISNSAASALEITDIEKFIVKVNY